MNTSCRGATTALTKAWRASHGAGLGRETFERLVQPLVAGIYTADPEKLSLAATLPRFQEMERQHGGLIRAALRQKAINKTVSFH